MAAEEKKHQDKKNSQGSREIILEIQKKPVETKSNGFLVSMEVSVFYEKTKYPVRNARIELREKGVFLTKINTSESGFGLIEYSFGLDRANSVVSLDVIVGGFSTKGTVEISIPSVFHSPKRPSKDPEHLSIELGYSESLERYYVIARLLQDRAVALKQDLVICIDGILVTKKTDKDGFLQYLVPKKLAPQNPGDEVKVSVTANGIKEPTYGYLRWDYTPCQPPVRKIFRQMLIAMPFLWTIALIMGFSNSFTRIIFAAVMIYSTVVVPIYFFYYISSFKEGVIQGALKAGRKIEEKFSTVAGDSTLEKIEEFMKDTKGNNKADNQNIFSSSSASGKGFKGWLNNTFRGMASFFADAVTFGGLTHIIKKIFH